MKGRNLDMVNEIPDYNINAIEFINSKLEYINKHQENLYNFRFDNTKETYDYKKAVYEDCYRETLCYLQEYLKKNIWLGGIDVADFINDPKDFKDEIKTAIKKLPNVTGIESGSYNCDTKVEKYLHGNDVLLQQAVDNIGIKLEQLIGGNRVRDTCIRSYLVPQVLDIVIVDISYELKEKEMEINKVQNEELYKKLSKKYIETMSNELLLEKNNKILCVTIEDQYIGLKYNGKINSYNYTNYLDYDYSIIEYNSYEDYFNNSLKHSIIEDIEDLGLYDENGNWDFYISKEELLYLKNDFLDIYKNKEKKERIMKHINSYEKKTIEEEKPKSLLEKAPTTNKDKQYER